MTFLHVFGFILRGSIAALSRKGWTTEEEQGVYHECKERDLLRGPAFNTPERQQAPKTSRSYLHLSISESDLQLLGTATDESLRL